MDYKNFKILKMKKNKTYVLYLLLIIGLIGCTSDFEEINTDTDSPSETPPSAILKSVIFEPINPSINMQFKLAGQVMQYLVYTNESSFDRYQFSSGSGVTDAYWDATYKSIRDARTLEAIADGDNGYLAAVKILTAYNYAMLTDLWIDVPATEAGFPSEYANPKYDNQLDIYTLILNNLKEANTLLTNPTKSFEQGGDVLFKGDVMRWRKMANSLRLKYLLRLSEPGKYANSQSEFEAIIADPATYPIITSNDDQAVYDISGTSPDVSDFANSSALSGITFSQRFIDQFVNGTNTSSADTSDDDPRFAFFSQRTDPANTEAFVGVISGGSESTAKTIADLPNAVKMRPIFQQDKGLLDYGYITHAELQFILAEAKLKGWNLPSTTKEYFDNGVTANFNYWGITMPANFLDRTDISITGNGVSNDEQLERVFQQKWVAGFGINIFDIWADKKRTGKPAMAIGVEAITISNNIPTRMLYPGLEKTVNATNYQAASTSIGGDNITVKHWYQN